MGRKRIRKVDRAKQRANIAKAQADPGYSKLVEKAIRRGARMDALYASVTSFNRYMDVDKFLGIPKPTPSGYTDYRRLDSYLLRTYGITLCDYQRMLADQLFACKICRAPAGGTKRLVVDHCHTTGRVRGLLCNGCNLAIGHARDNTATLKYAIAYLTRG